jgi:Tfp pilus assembly protein PilP
MIWRVLVLGGWMLATTAGAEPRDPFSPPATGPVAPTALERLDLDQLRLVALAHDARAARALLEDTTGIGYIVGIGTPVGRRGGVVVAIERGRLRIREPDGDDDIVLALSGASESGR